MAMRPVLSSVTLVALLLTALFAGCAKEEPPPPPAVYTLLQQRFQQAMQDFQNQDVYFDFDKYDLRPDARAILDKKVAFLNENSSMRVQIEGHCDERGTSEYNLVLGERRANASKQYVTTAGVNTARLSTISYGKERPLDPGHDEAAWARNRRAHFVITGQ